MIGVSDAEHDLRRHERGSAAGAALGAEFDGFIVSLPRSIEFDQTEIEHLGKIKRCSRPADHYVRRLDVAMYQPIGVRVQQQLSVRDTARATIGAASFSVDYSRPLARGRTLLGNVISYDRVWRTGANAATQFTTSAPITIGGCRCRWGPTPCGLSRASAA